MSRSNTNSIPVSHCTYVYAPPYAAPICAAVGGYLEPEELVADVSQECREAVESYVVAEVGGCLH